MVIQLTEEEIIFYGHSNVQSYHARTIEITKEKYLSLRGDCIIGVNANKSCKDLSFHIKKKIQKNDSLIKIELIVEPYSFIIHGNGSERLSLLNIHDITVTPEFRGRGLSKKIMQKVEEIAQEIGCCKITLEVLEGNKVAQALYMSCGFAAYSLDATMGSALFWQKKL